MKLSLLILLLFTTAVTFGTDKKTINIKELGATGDAQTLNTKFIQSAIDETAESGGGKIIVPPGIFLTGSILLKDHVELKLEKGAVLLGSANLADYKKGSRWYALILSENTKHIRITGEGVIDGNALELVNDVMGKIRLGEIKDSYHRNRPDEAVRPQLIEFTNCTNVTIQDITLQNGAGWTQTYINCDSLLIKGEKVRSFKYWNNDGIDLVDCKNVLVENCDIVSEDDGICLKSHDSSRLCENIRIANCKVSSGSSAFKCGTASYGGFKNVKVDSLYIYDTYRSAIALMVVDGGSMEDVEISNVNVKNSSGSFFIDIGRRNQNTEAGTINNIRLKNITMEVNLDGKNINHYRPNFHFPPAGERPAPHNPYPSTISGLPDQPIKNVSFMNVTIKYFGGGNKQTAYVSTDSLSLVPYNEKNYPEFHMFGELPSSAFFVRNVEGLQFKNINISYLKPDYRPAFVFNQVKNLTIDKLNIANFENLPAIVLNKVQHEEIRDIKVPVQNNNIIKRQD